MKKPSRKDPFDLNLTFRGLGNLVTELYDNIYEYAYVFTFKRSMKMYREEFYDAYEVPIDDLSFFNNTGDPYVEHCMLVFELLAKYKIRLREIFGLDELCDLEDERVIHEAKRYAPYMLLYKHSKSYKRLKLYYERQLSECCLCFFTYACMLTAQRYQIPRQLMKPYDSPDGSWKRLLNDEDYQVALLIDLISDLKKCLADLRDIMNKQMAKTIARRKKKPITAGV
ncbi:hypothetical protein ACSBL2_17175 [Pedobacter sp. AW31-3R]|uniref:hypothetical protein n=1 Tax=Pedobacter sp. AW31-3R TaxID=3445781 RepID=UPI003FA123C3